MTPTESRHTPSRTNERAWFLFLSMLVIFFIGRESTFMAVGILCIVLAWLSLFYAIVTLYRVLHGRTHASHILVAAPVVLVAGFLAFMWTLDLAKMLLGYGD